MKSLEKDHFLFLKELIRIEEKEEFDQIRDEFTSLSPSERQLRGKALLDLRLLERHYSPAGHSLATFSLKDKAPLPVFTLEVGDMVSLVSDVSSDGFLTGTVYERSAGSITVAFLEELPEGGERFELHRSVNRVTFKRMAETLDAVYQTQNTRLAVLRDISLGTKKATAKDIDAASIRWFDAHLNDSQKKAVLMALEANDIALVHGPPGTGKTTALIELIRQSLLRKQSIFVTAPSNTACDNLLERLVEKNVNTLRLGHPARVSDPLRRYTLDFKLALHPAAKDIVKAEAEVERLKKRLDRQRDRGVVGAGLVPAQGRPQGPPLRREISLLNQEIKNLRKEVFQRVMKEAEVVVGTPTGIQDRSVRDRKFDLVVIDEATQATEPICWIPMTSAQKVVMAGDHFQLPPTVRSREAEDKGLGRTLFERYHGILGEDFRTLLDRQYRMNEKIMGFSSKMFYGGKLIADESVKDRTIAGQAPLLFIDTAGKGFEEKLETGSESRYNPEEAQLLLDELQRMLDAGVSASEIAVISPYSAQVRYLRDRVGATGRSPLPEIDSVDGFQGREKDLVIVSLVRSNLTGELGFLNDTRRMNVAMTRARKRLVVIGDSATLSSLPFYKAFIEYAEGIGGYKTAWELGS